MEARRVVITGIGAITPLGDFMETWRRVVDGEPNVTPITNFAVADSRTQIASQIATPLNSYLGKVSKEGARSLRKRGNRASTLAVIAAVDACEDAGILDEQGLLEERYRADTAAFIGTGLGAPEEIVAFGAEKKQQTATAILRMLPDSIPGNVAKTLNIHGGIKCNVQACATGAGAVSDAMDSIQLGRAAIVLAGGVEAFSKTAHDAFALLGATTARNTDPQRASRPFDRGRDGFVMAEGACVLVMEELRHALERQARIYAEILGSALKSGAGNDTDPSTPIQTLTMQEALRRAHVHKTDVRYINAHGTSTMAGDISEIAAIKQAFGRYADSICVSSTKSTTGHLMGAAGALETAFTTVTLATDIIPPTINLNDLDPACAGVRHIVHKLEAASPSIALNNSFGFFDQCVCIVLATS